MFVYLLFLKEFGVFLRENGPFDYVIDAANVAYQNQNFNEGRFNYEQVRILSTALLRLSSSSLCAPLIEYRYNHTI